MPTAPARYASAGDVWMQIPELASCPHAAPVSAGLGRLCDASARGRARPRVEAPVRAGLNEAARHSPRKQDSYFQTVMSYSAKPGFDGGADFYPTTPMYLDIVAMQALVRNGHAANTGSNVYHFADARKYWQTIYDTGGRDTIAYSGHEAAHYRSAPGQVQLPRRARFSFSDGISVPRHSCIGPDTVIETAIGGTGRDKIIGNSAANSLQGRERQRPAARRARQGPPRRAARAATYSCSARNLSSANVDRIVTDFDRRTTTRSNWRMRSLRH